MDSDPIRMRRELTIRQPPFVWPRGVSPRGFAEFDAREIHTLIRLAYGDGGGDIPPFDIWWPQLKADSEYDPDLIFLAVDDDHGAIAGVAHCWTSGFIKDLAVHPDWLRRGIGRVLLSSVFARFADLRFTAVDLKVRPDNERAMSLYRRVGMKVIEQGG